MYIELPMQSECLNNKAQRGTTEQTTENKPSFTGRLGTYLTIHIGALQAK